MELSNTNGFPDSEIISMAQWRSISQLYGPRKATSRICTSPKSHDKNLGREGNGDGIKEEYFVHLDDVGDDVDEMKERKDRIHGSKIFSTAMPFITAAESTCNQIDEFHHSDENIFEIKLSLHDEHRDERSEGIDSKEGSEKENKRNPKAGFWIWTPACCRVCMDEIEQRKYDIDTNFKNVIFDVIIVQPSPEVLNASDGSRREGVTDDSLIDSGTTSNAAATAVSNISQYDRRNPTRIRASRRGMKTVKVSLSSKDLVSNVKIKLAEKVDEETFRGLAGHVLMYGGLPMTDNLLSLKDYKVKSGETLYLHIVRKGKESLQSGDNDVFALLSSMSSKSGYFSEKGFQGSFLSGSSVSAGPTVNTSSSSLDGKDTVILVDMLDPNTVEESINNVMDVTRSTFDQARKALVECGYSVNEACDYILDLT